MKELAMLILGVFCALVLLGVAQQGAGDVLTQAIESALN